MYLKTEPNRDRSTIAIYPVSHLRRWAVKNIGGVLCSCPERCNEEGIWVWRPIDCVQHGPRDSMLADLNAQRNAREQAHHERDSW